MRQWIIYIAFILALFQTNTAYAQSADHTSAVIFSYSRVGDDTHPRSNVSLQNFQAHIQELLYGGYTVLPLPKIIHAFKTHTKLPPKTVGITFDAGYKSAINHAVPLLTQANLPFTIFVAANDISHPEVIDWNTLKRLKKKHKKLVTFGLYPNLDKNLLHLDTQDTLHRLNAGRVLIKEHLKTHVKLLAYPHGAYNEKLHNIASRSGFDASFGLHSGAAHDQNDPFALPRFSMSDKYSDLERFTLVARALPLPTSGAEPAYSYIGKTEVSGIGFTLPQSLEDKTKQLSCFISGQEQPDINILGKTRVEIRPKTPITDHRTRMNCTIPEKNDDETRWRWFGMLLIRD